MIEYAVQIQFILAGAVLMSAVLGLGIAVIMPGIDRWSKNFFIAFFTVFILYSGSVIVDLFTYTRHDMRTVQVLISYIESLFASLLMPMITAYLLHCCEESWIRSRFFHIVVILWSVFFVMLSISPFSTFFFYTTPDNIFQRGPLYSPLIAAIFAILVLDLAYVIRFRNRLSQRCFYAFLIGFLPLTVILFIHFFVSVFFLFGIGIAICSLSMFNLILLDQLEQYTRQQRKIAHQRANIMVLQMRPHFISNTMMSIYYLCKQNPDLAQQVTLDFTTYLRKNFTAIASEDLISFSDELEHTRAYLAVEQAQFEDSLFVEYDTPHTDFLVPPLTLQPIVENAVKHGMDPDSEPLHIFISTRKNGSASEFIVENTGADFEPADGNEPHTALQNIEQRLEMMCDGKMLITRRKGGGTVVKVTIP